MNRAAQARGRWAERRAAADYEREGYEILSRNWRSPVPARRGEIDIVCRRDDTLVFCEVKARADSSRGDAALAVDDRKQRQVRALAELWLIDHAVNGGDVSIRFDVVAVNGTELRRIEAAF